MRTIFHKIRKNKEWWTFLSMMTMKINKFTAKVKWIIIVCQIHHQIMKYLRKVSKVQLRVEGVEIHQKEKPYHKMNLILSPISQWSLKKAVKWLWKRVRMRVNLAEKRRKKTQRKKLISRVVVILKPAVFSFEQIYFIKFNEKLWNLQWDCIEKNSDNSRLIWVS